MWSEFGRDEMRAEAYALVSAVNEKRGPPVPLFLQPTEPRTHLKIPSDSALIKRRITAVISTSRSCIDYDCCVSCRLSGYGTGSGPGDKMMRETKQYRRMFAGPAAPESRLSIEESESRLR